MTVTERELARRLHFACEQLVLSAEVRAGLSRQVVREFPSPERPEVDQELLDAAAHDLRTTKEAAALLLDGVPDPRLREVA